MTKASRITLGSSFFLLCFIASLAAQGLADPRALPHVFQSLSRGSFSLSLRSGAVAKDQVAAQLASADLDGDGTLTYKEYLASKAIKDPGAVSAFDLALADLLPRLKDFAFATQGGVAFSGILDSDWLSGAGSVLVPANSRVFGASGALLVESSTPIDTGGEPWLVSSEWYISQPVRAPQLASLGGSLIVLRFSDRPRGETEWIPSDLDFARARGVLEGRGDKAIGGRHLIDRVLAGVEKRYGKGAFERFNVGQLVGALNELALSELYIEDLSTLSLPKAAADLVAAAKNIPPATKAKKIALNRVLIERACPELFATPRFEALRGTISDTNKVFAAPSLLGIRDLEWLALQDAWSWFRANPPLRASFSDRRDRVAIVDQLGMETPFEVFTSWARNNEQNGYRAGTKDASAIAAVERSYPILRYIRHSEERALAEIRSTRLESGVRIWKLYNMGTIVKTKESCFSLDLWPMTTDFSGVLDFAVVSHVHDDHYSRAFLEAMSAAGKTVYSPFWTKGIRIGEAKTLQRGALELEFRPSFQVQFGVPSLVTVIDCGASTSHFVLMHTGDSNRASDFPRLGPIHLAISPWDFWDQNPDQGAYHSIAYASRAFDHRLEMAHSIGWWRSPFEGAYAKIEELGLSSSAVVLVWGEVLDFARPPELRPSPFVIDYRFDTGSDGWRPANGIADFSAKAGAISGRATNGDPYLILEPLEVPGSASPIVEARLAASSGSSLALYWITEDDRNWDEAKALHLPLVADGAPHVYRFAVGEKATWSGRKIIGLRLDPLEGAAGSFAVEEIVAAK